jgi:spore germination protein KC
MVALFLLLTLTGCWSRYEVQNMNYATAVGIDYVDGQYTLYVQLLDFSTVAKLEGQQKRSSPRFGWAKAKVPRLRRRQMICTVHHNNA